jgi:hypothetical protein
MTANPEGAIAQLGERLLCKQEVVGSIPSGSTNLRGDYRSNWPELRTAKLPLKPGADAPDHARPKQNQFAPRGAICKVRVICHREEEIDPSFVHGLRRERSAYSRHRIRACLCGVSCHECDRTGAICRLLDRTPSERS